MGYADLNSKYQQLRDDLEEAYAANVWDSSKIDRIADEIVETELALAGQLRFSAPGGHSHV
ncbi:hypothetical protein [Aquabacterium sp.]|uniref:hypothetical protein n=1 Tax=Aquabacterium sp. TaxID=1872578 RepID=UPI002487160D|nr:hypothetical protein [Aquabacterium sp.]MDI1260425.1 hypothetical protein [Aquabacterium sp.]